MATLTRTLALAFAIGLTVPLRPAPAEENHLNWYFYPFEYCANMCNTPLCCWYP
jgi:hypothetical protein